MSSPWLNRIADQIIVLRDRISSRRRVEWWTKLRDRFRPPSGAEIRQAATRRRLVLAGLLVLMSVLAVVAWIFLRPAPPITTDAPHRAWFYDLSNGQLFVQMSTQIPPIPAPSGKAAPDGTPGGVRAYVFSCSPCTDVNARFIGWLERYAPDVQRILQNPPPDVEGQPPTDLTAVAARGHFIARPPTAVEGKPPAPIEWVEDDSGEARQLREEANRDCGNGRLPNQCLP